MRLFMSLAAALLAILSVPALSQPTLAPRPLAPQPEQAAPAIAPAGQATLTRADLEAWLDGYMPFALARSDVAGGVVVVVKDGQVLLQKGYGYSDVAKRKPVSPEATLFRPGSVSKLLTWTAVMQLVGEGKLNLDADVNTYLGFKIPAYNGKPVTLRNIMTHTAGFEESVRYLIISDPQRMMSLGEFSRLSLPARVFAPGTTPAYSNYATALAGHIIERASGLSFDDYIDQRVLQPLGMTRSSFRQPLPANLRPLMSQGYLGASGEPKPYEYVVAAPAGSLAATGADMGKFMIAHLANGRGLMSPQTARLMHESRLTLLPPLNRMALGFYETNINGHRAIAHGGDTQYFHSYLWLFQDDNVGLYISVNSEGVPGSSRAIREALFTQFADRYFPAPQAGGRVPDAVAREHARMMAGSYTNSRGSFTSFLRILDLVGQAKLGVNDRGELVAAPVTGLADQQRKWVEIAPFVWRDAASGERLAAKVENGRVVRWSFDAISAIMVFDRTPWYLDSAWLLPALLAGLTIITLTALAWPVGAIARRRYKATLPFEGRALLAHRLTYGFAWLIIVALGLWTIFMVVGLNDLEMWSGPLDPLLWSAQILTAVAFFGLSVVAVWRLWLVWTERRGWFSKLWSVLLVLSAVVMLWVGLGFNLIGFGTHY